MNNQALTLPVEVASRFPDFWHLSGQKIQSIAETFDVTKGAPVFTIDGKYTSRGWTEWTQGFQFGAAILQFEATQDEAFLEMGKSVTVKWMAPHVSHFGVHDHGFNNVSTYGNLHRLMVLDQIPVHPGELDFYRLALKLSGAVQAQRWTPLAEGGYIYSFNGPHSLFVDTIRSLRALEVSHMLGHEHRGENDRVTSLLDRAMDHALATARYSVYYGEGRDHYDEWGRTAHESVFNTNDGQFRCPNSQQGFSGFTTWTRGLAWAMLGFAEQLEFLKSLEAGALDHRGGLKVHREIFYKAARATCDFYLAHCCSDGIPFWDTGAPQLVKLGEYQKGPSDPYNAFEPVDSSAAAIGAQGLFRLAHYCRGLDESLSDKYWQGGLRIVNTLLNPPYLSESDDHQGLLLHSIYHRPNGWDHIPKARLIPCHESSMWGDYHMRELILYLQRLAEGKPYYTFFEGLEHLN